MAKEFKIELATNTADAIKSIDELQAKIKEIKKTFESTKFGSDEYKNAQKELVALNAEQKKHKDALRETQQAYQVNENSIKGLQQANKKLREEVRGLNLDDAEHVKRIKELNKAIDENDAKIRANSDSLTKQKINIGNYASAVTGLGDSFKSAIGTTQAFGNSLKLLSANPVGASLQLIVLSLNGIIDLFKRSEEGANNFNAVMFGISTTFDVLKDIVFEFIGFLGSIFTEPLVAFEKFKKTVLEPLMLYWTSLAKGAQGLGLAIAGIFDEELAKKSKKYFEEAKEGFRQIADIGKSAYDRIAGSASKAYDLSLRQAKNENDILKFKEQEAILQEKINKLDTERKEIKNDAEARKKVAEQELALIEEKYNKEIALAQEAYDIQVAINSLSATSREDADKEQQKLNALKKLQADREKEIQKVKLDISKQEREDAEYLRDLELQRLKLLEKINQKIGDEFQRGIEKIKNEYQQLFLEMEKLGIADANLKKQLRDQEIKEIDDFTRNYKDKQLQAYQDYQAQILQVFGDTAELQILQESKKYDALIKLAGENADKIVQANGTVITGQMIIEQKERAILEIRAENARRLLKTIEDLNTENLLLAINAEAKYLENLEGRTKDQTEALKQIYGNYLDARIIQLEEAKREEERIIRAGIDDEEKLSEDQKARLLKVELDYQNKRLDAEKQTLDKIKGLNSQQVKNMEKVVGGLLTSAISVGRSVSDALFTIETESYRAIIENQKRALQERFEFETTALNQQKQLGEITEETYNEKLLLLTQEKAKKEQELSRQQAEKEKKQKLAQAVINGALAITNILATMPMFDFGIAQGIAIATAIASTATQVGVISSAKFAKGGVLKGKSHAEGGVQLFSKNGNHYGEAEGGEVILTKAVSSSPTLLARASEINQLAGGVALTNNVNTPRMQNGGIAQRQQQSGNMVVKAYVTSNELKNEVDKAKFKNQSRNPY